MVELADIPHQVTQADIASEPTAYVLQPLSVESLGLAQGQLGLYWLMLSEALPAEKQ